MLFPTDLARTTRTRMLSVGHHYLLHLRKCPYQGKQYSCWNPSRHHRLQPRTSRPGLTEIPSHQRSKAKLNNYASLDTLKCCVITLIVYCIPSVVYIGLTLATVKQNVNLAATLVWSPTLYGGGRPQRLSSRGRYHSDISKISLTLKCKLFMRKPIARSKLEDFRFNSLLDC